jgi:hypothetical protein
VTNARRWPGILAAVVAVALLGGGLFGQGAGQAASAPEAVSLKLVARGSVALRAVPSETAALVAMAGKGMALEATRSVVASGVRWYLVSVAGASGWVAADMVDVTGGTVPKTIVSPAGAAGNQETGMPAPSPGAPLVLVTSPDGTRVTIADRTTAEITVEAWPGDRPLDRILLSVNGALAAVGKAPEVGSRVRQRLPVALSPGANRVEVTAVDNAGQAGAPYSLDLIREDRPAAATLFILAVGVGEYRNPDYRLALPARDARAVVQAFNRPSSRVFANIRSLVLTDEAATRPAILAARRDFLAQAGPDDAVLVFFAGHGVTGLNGHYYFLSWEADAERPETGGISDTELRETLLAGLSCRQALFLFDTCHSGAVANRRLATHAWSFADVADRIGSGAPVYVISSAQGDQLSREPVELGNGYLAWALSRMVGVDSGDADGNRRVDIIELFKGLRQLVVAQSGGAQVPQGKLLGPGSGANIFLYRIP